MDYALNKTPPSSMPFTDCSPLAASSRKKRRRPSPMTVLALKDIRRRQWVRRNPTGSQPQMWQPLYPNLPGIRRQAAYHNGIHLLGWHERAPCAVSARKVTNEEKTCPTSIPHSGEHHRLAEHSGNRWDKFINSAEFWGKTFRSAEFIWTRKSGLCATSSGVNLMNPVAGAPARTAPIHNWILFHLNDLLNPDASPSVLPPLSQPTARAAASPSSKEKHLCVSPAQNASLQFIFAGHRATPRAMTEGKAFHPAHHPPEARQRRRATRVHRKL